jgi:hypothetical protein
VSELALHTAEDARRYQRAERIADDISAIQNCSAQTQLIALVPFREEELRKDNRKSASDSESVSDRACIPMARRFSRGLPLPRYEGSSSIASHPIQATGKGNQKRLLTNAPGKNAASTNPRKNRVRSAPTKLYVRAYGFTRSSEVVHVRVSSSNGG